MLEKITVRRHMTYPIWNHDEYLYNRWVYIERSHTNMRKRVSGAIVRRSHVSMDRLHVLPIEPVSSADRFFVGNDIEKTHNYNILYNVVIRSSRSGFFFSQTLDAVGITVPFGSLKGRVIKWVRINRKRYRLSIYTIACSYIVIIYNNITVRLY